MHVVISCQVAEWRIHSSWCWCRGPAGWRGCLLYVLETARHGRTYNVTNLLSKNMRKTEDKNATPKTEMSTLRSDGAK